MKKSSVMSLTLKFKVSSFSQAFLVLKKKRFNVAKYLICLSELKVLDKKFLKNRQNSQYKSQNFSHKSIKIKVYYINRCKGMYLINLRDKLVANRAH